MQSHGLPKVSPPGGSRARVRSGKVSAGVAQLVEHLFCKQAVRGSSPLASSRSAVLVTSRLATSPEGCPSGQREQAVNLPAHAYVGSNPTPSTAVLPAGVAQLVERQPSKLNVVGSSPISRSRRLPVRASSLGFIDTVLVRRVGSQGSAALPGRSLCESGLLGRGGVPRSAPLIFRLPT